MIKTNMATFATLILGTVALSADSPMREFYESLSSSQICDEKIYIDENETSLDAGAFRIHTGHNVWIETTTIHGDSRRKNVFFGVESTWREFMVKL